MPKSELQDAFMQELVLGFEATANRLSRRLREEGGKSDTADAEIVHDELRGLLHGVLVVFDGGSALANKGLIRIVDEGGVAFDRYLHELCFQYWPKIEVD